MLEDCCSGTVEVAAVNIKREDLLLIVVVADLSLHPSWYFANTVAPDRNSHQTSCVPIPTLNRSSLCSLHFFDRLSTQAKALNCINNEQAKIVVIIIEKEEVIII